MPVYECAFTQSNKNSTASLSSAFLLPFVIGSDGPSSERAIAHQVVRLCATTSAASQTATIALILAETTETNAERIAIYTATVTSTAYTTESTGTSDPAFMATVAFAESGDSKFDLLGHGEQVVPISSAFVAGAQRGKKLQWYLSCITLDSGTMKVFVIPTRAI